MKSILRFIKYSIIPYFKAIPTYLNQGECQSYLDCVLFHKLVSKAPSYYDRALEYPWALKNVNISKGRFLDVGSTVGIMFRDNLPKDVEVFTLNLEDEKRFPKQEGIQAKRGDIRKTEFDDNYFDVITCISTLEHIGVEGRYHVKADPLGDEKAMKEILRILKPGGKLLLTVPYGKYDVLPINKLYNKERIRSLSKGYNVISQTYQKFDPKFHIWKEVDEQQAGSTEWLKERWYALGLFILEKPGR